MPKNSKKCKGFEVFQRLNYLFQAQEIMAKNHAISSYYGNVILNVAKKSVLKIDPGLKRRICKRCKGVLLLEETLIVKIVRKNKNPIVSYKCKHCAFVKQYPIFSGKNVWTETSEALVNVIKCDVSNESSPQK